MSSTSTSSAAEHIAHKDSKQPVKMGLPSIHVTTATLLGFSGIAVDVECAMTNSLPGISIVGLGSKAIDEAKERIRAACMASSLQVPPKRIILNLAPADLPKTGAGFDLPMALAILSTSNQIFKKQFKTTGVIGELSLDGSVRPVPGIIGVVKAFRDRGMTAAIVPAGNLIQARLVDDITLYPARSLKQVFLHLSGALPIEPITTGSEQAIRSSVKSVSVRSCSFDNVQGHQAVKRALAVAAAGQHNILMNGPPGTGKSMLARAMTELLPQPSPKEIVQINQIAGITGSRQIVTARPFQTAHNTATHIALIGGGRPPKPGLVSKAHGGVLFLDELPEFNRQCIESLRQPLEDGYVDLARADYQLRFPARAMLVATKNPCPCGFYGDPLKSCSCDGYSLQKYRKKLSGPIMDRIDMHIEVPRINSADIVQKTTSTDPGFSAQAMRANIQQACSAQHKRNGGMLNSALSSRQIRDLPMEQSARELLITAGDKLQLSARVIVKTIALARTINDFDSHTGPINSAGIAEALRYRPQELQ